ncbi:MAG TPA: GMC family oxidoreductase [Acidobacteriaceae bacterium]|nr:GMC family oxidoreductase [Acidobacteriaceae bacterium]
MIFDLESVASLPEFVADVCVVGAGVAGLVLSAELVRQGKRVLLIESGGTEPEAAVQNLNACFYTGQPRRTAHAGHCRVLGGTSTAWGGQILELTDGELASRTWVPGSGWPFSKAELKPYYERALIAEGLSSAVQRDEEVWQQMKADPPPLGKELEAYFTRWCPEPNFARLYGEALNSSKLCVLLHATASAMLLSPDGARVEGVRARTCSGRQHDFTAPRFVFCLGTIETIRFLLQAGGVRGAEAWNRSGLLGRHFQSHIDYNAASVAAEDALRLRRWFANAYLRGLKYHPKFRLSVAEQQERQILNIAGSITCIHPAEMELRRVKRLARNFLQGRKSESRWQDLPSLARQSGIMLMLAYGYRVQRRAWWSRDSAFWLRVHCEQEPKSQSRVTLTDVRDSVGLFQAKLDWRVSPLEWRTIREFTRQVRKNLGALGVTKILCQPELELEDGFGKVVFDNSYHDMGGTRMSEGPADGVVDPNLKLHGMANAYLCSASVFPAGGFSNPTHTLIALAIRLADHLVSLQPRAISIEHRTVHA